MRYIAGFCLMGSLAWSGATLAIEKKAAPAPPAAHPAAPAAKPGAPAPAGAHPGAPAGAANGAPHITTANPGGGAHPITTSNPGGGAHPTTSNPGGVAHPTTSSPGGAQHPTTGAAGGARPGAVPARPGAPGGVRPGGTSFAGRPAPAGAHEMHAANGAAVRTRPDGSKSDFHDPKRGMDIHHGLNGNRSIVAERPDHSRVFAASGGRGYVQHPYTYQGHEFGHRTYYANGRAYDNFYGRYPYRGGYLDVYAPARFYPYGFYGYAYSPWAAPVPYAWGWGGQPWYGYYGAYYAPYPVYPAPAFWLADFIVAASLQAAFTVRVGQLGPAPAAAPALLLASDWLSDLMFISKAAAAPVSPAMSADTKQALADEIKAMVQAEGTEAQANAANQTPAAAAGSVTHLLGDNRPHVFLAGADLDVVASSGQECPISQGDVVRVSAPPAGDADSITATVLAAKGGKECAMASSVTIAVTDLQDMQNHMREMIDQGMTELQSKQGQNGIPAAPAGATGAPVPAAFTAGAPPPDADAAAEIRKESAQADAAEKEVDASVTSSGANDGTAAPPTIALGQSVETVTATLGNPSKVIDLGVKKIYTYPDMKIVFINGKVSDVQ